MNRYACLLLIVGLLGACGRESTPDAAPVATDARPNAVLVVMDTLRADRLHAVRNGQPVMPFLSRMAATGTWYSHAISPSSWTKPAMASLLTGLAPEAHGVVYSARLEDPDNPTSDRLADSHTTLAEHFRAAGYRTWAFQTNANLTAPLGFAQGYAPEDYLFYNGAPADRVTEAALAALPDLGAPFFLYAHYMEPHAPYRPDPRHGDALGEAPAIPAEDRALLDDDTRFMGYYLDQVETALGLRDAHALPDLSAEGKAAVLHRYDLECFAMDRAMEQLAKGIWARHPNTAIVFVSDHGEEFWERGGMGHGTTLHQEQVHVPLILVGPAFPAEEVKETVSSLVLHAMLLQLLGGGGQPAGRPTLPETVFSFSRGPWPGLGVNTSAAFRENYSYLVDRRTGKTALYYLPEDPGELENLAEGQADVAARLASLLDGYLRGMGSGAPSEHGPLDPETREQLEALGYVDTP